MQIWYLLLSALPRKYYIELYKGLMNWVGDTELVSN